MAYDAFYALAKIYDFSTSFEHQSLSMLNTKWDKFLDDENKPGFESGQPLISYISLPASIPVHCIPNLSDWISLDSVRTLDRLFRHCTIRWSNLRSSDEENEPTAAAYNLNRAKVATVEDAGLEDWLRS